MQCYHHQPQVGSCCLLGNNSYKQSQQTKMEFSTFLKDISRYVKCITLLFNTVSDIFITGMYFTMFTIGKHFNNKSAAFSTSVII